MEQYAYLAGCAILFTLFWLPLYLYRRETRPAMLLMSAFAAPLGPLTTLFYWHDYWMPLYAVPALTGLEDFIFSFLIGGVAGAAYSVAFGLSAPGPRPRGKRWWAAGLALAGMLVLYVGTLLGFNSMYVSYALLGVLAFILIAYRPRLIVPALFGAVATAAAMLVMYQVWFYLFPSTVLWWNLGALSGTLISGVPIEELYWGAAWGFFAGAGFEFVAQSRYILTNGPPAHKGREVS